MKKTSPSLDKIKKIAKKIKGRHANNAYGTITIQHNKEAELIAEQGYALINCSLANRQQARVDYLRKNRFYTTGVTSGRKANWIVEIMFNNFDKKLKKAGFDSDIILDNLATDGYTGQYICVLVNQNKKPKPEKVENMRIASMRHSLTNYDNISKKGLSDYQVRELRRQANSMV